MTLPADVIFTRFTANASLWHGPAHPASTPSVLGGWAGGEGSYGLILVGSASIANCNATHACCDGYGGAGFSDVIASLERGREASSPLLGRYVRSASGGNSSNSGATFGWTDVGAYPTEIGPVWGSGALLELNKRFDQLGSWRSGLDSAKQEWPWWGWDDGGNIAVIPQAQMAAIAAQWDATSAADAAGRSIRSFLAVVAANGTGAANNVTGNSNATVMEVTGWSDADIASAVANGTIALAPVASAPENGGGSVNNSTIEVLDVEHISRLTPQGTPYGYWRHRPRPVRPGAFYDPFGRKYVGCGSDPASHCVVGCDRLRRVAQGVSGGGSTVKPWAGWDEEGAPRQQQAANDGIIDTASPVSGSGGWTGPYGLSSAPQSSSYSSNGSSSSSATSSSSSSASPDSPPPSSPCGPALRLTGSHPGHTGAAWYGRPLMVSLATSRHTYTCSILCCFTLFFSVRALLSQF